MYPCKNKKKWKKSYFSRKPCVEVSEIGLK